MLTVLTRHNEVIVEIGLLYLSRNPDFSSLHDELGYKEITERIGEKLSEHQP